MDHQTGILQLVHDCSPAEYRNSLLLAGKRDQGAPERMDGAFLTASRGGFTRKSIASSDTWESVGPDLRGSRMASTVRSRPNHYETLGLTPTAGHDEIIRAFGKQMIMFKA